MWPRSSLRRGKHVPPEHRLRREVERDLEDLVHAPRADLLEEAEVVHDVLDDVEDEHQVERPGGPLLRLVARDVDELEVQAVVRALQSVVDRHRRDVVSPELALARQARLQLHEDLAEPAADLAHGPRRQAVPLHEGLDVLGLPRRLLRMPVGDKFVVFGARVARFEHGSIRFH